MRRTKKFAGLLGIVFILLSSVACRETTTPLTTEEVAHRYLDALIAGDREAAAALYQAEALCSSPFDLDTIDDLATQWQGRQIRNVAVDVTVINGPVAYHPGSESAHITFDALNENGDWVAAELFIVTGPAPEDADRAICYVPSPA